MSTISTVDPARAHVTAGYLQVGHLYQHIGYSHGPILVIAAELVQMRKPYVVYTLLLDDGTTTKTRWPLHDAALADWELVSWVRAYLEASDHDRT